MKEPVPPLPVLQARLEDMIALVRDAERRVLSNKAVSLTSLDQDVGRMCTLLNRASPEIKQAVAPLVAEMISTLENLASILKTQCDSVPKTLH